MKNKNLFKVIFILFVITFSACENTPANTIDITSPAEVTLLTAIEGNGQISLSWTNPTDADFETIEIWYGSGSATTLFSGIITNTGTIISGLTNGTEYTLKIFTLDTRGNISSGTTIIVIPVVIEPSDNQLNLASWNIRILSDASRDDTELQKIADIIELYDFVAIQEVRDTTVLTRLEAMLTDWDFIVSDSVGNSVTERYAYFYKADTVQPLGTPYIYGDPNNVFIREPYIAHFRSGEFDFTAITIHVIYGDSVTDRRAEAALLDDVISNVDIANASENDVILMGDFNLPGNDAGWEISTHDYLVPATTMTTITDTSSYDNFWINSVYTVECDDSIEVYKFDETFVDDATASLEVSDHRPISTFFDTTSDDDNEGNWTATAGDELIQDPSGNQTDGDVRITNVVYTPTESESVTIHNYSAWDVDLSLWTIGDLNNPNAYDISNGTVISAGTSITYSSQLNFGINDSGETIYLKNNGVLKDTY